MAIKARDQVTIAVGVDVASVDIYYKLQLSTATPPIKPSTANPSGWSTTEPTYDSVSTNTLYTCQKTTLTDGTFYWSSVSKSTSYEAAKTAWNLANSASTAIDNIQVGGRNLLPQTKTLSGYTKNSSEITIIDGVLTFPGTSSSWFYVHTPNIPFDYVDGNDLVFSFDYKLDVSTKVYIVAEGLSANVVDITRTRFRDNRYDFAESDEWTRWSIVFSGMSLAYLSQGSGDVNYFRLAIYNRRDNSNLKMRLPKLEKGNKATDWTPAPEDLASASDSIEYIEGTQTGATGAWTGSTKDSALYAGKSIAYKLPYAGSGNATLSLVLGNVDIPSAWTDDATGSDVTGVNLLKNSATMSVGTSSSWANGVWRVAGGTTGMTRSRVQITDGPNGSCYGVQGVGIQTLTTDTTCWAIDSMPRTANGVYTFSFYARVVGGGVAQAGWNVGNAIKTIDTNATETFGTAQYWLKTLDSSGAWTRVWATVCATTASANIYIGVIATDTTSKTVQICNVKIEKLPTAIAPVYLGTTRMTTHFGAGSVIQMTYDGANWRATSIPDTNNFDRRMHNNAVYAVSAITAAYLICGTDAGYKNVAAAATFDLSYPILYAAAAIEATKTSTYTYEALPSVNFSTTGTIEGGSAYKQLYLKGTVSGNIFTVAASPFLTTVQPTTANGYFYIPIGVMVSATTGYFATSKDLYAYTDGAFRKVNPATIVATQKIYYRSNAESSGTGVKPNGNGLPTTWVTNTSNTFNTTATNASGWSTKASPLTNDGVTGSTKYPYLWTCEQRKRLDGTVAYTDIVLDDSTTIIDGGKVITGSITANALAANSVTADKIQANAITIGKINSTDTSTASAILNSEVESKIMSRGEQLIVNGNGFMGDNTNFSQLTFDGSQANGSPGSFTKAISYATPFSDSFFPVDASKEYICEFDVKAGSTNSAAMYAMLVFFDVDKRLINVQMVSYFDGSTTTLAQELKNGDTKVYLTNASGFANTSAAHERSLIIWDYTNSFGYTYPAETYSRNYYAGVYSSDSDVDKTNNVISLASAWTGGTHAAGTPISQNRSGNYYSYFWYITNKALFPTEWTHVTGIYSGTRNTGAPNQTGKFWLGTAYCKIGWLWNYGANTTTNIQDPIWVTNISVKENVATVQALDSAVDAARSAVEASASYRDQIIYRSAASGTTSMSKNTTWVTDVTGGQNKWTTRRPEYSQSYPVLFVAVQRQTITQSSGTSCTCTTPAIDNTTTVIDGGNIITGTVTANKLNASDINASKSLTVGAMTDAAASTILNSNVQVGGRNLLLWSAPSAENHTKIANPSSSNSFATEDGYACYKITGGATNGTQYASNGKSIVSLEADTQYTYSAWVKLTTTGSTTNVPFNFTSLGHFSVIKNDSAASDKTHEDIPAKRVYSPATVSVGVWTKIQLTFTTNSLNGSKFGLYPKFNLGDTYTLFIRDQKLEKGNKATDWTPAPEDVDADISEAAQTATNFLTTVDSTGLLVHRANNTNSGVKITDDVDIIRSGTSIANYGSTTRIGPANDKHLVIDADSFDFIDDTTNVATLELLNSNQNDVTVNLRLDGGFGNNFLSAYTGQVVHDTSSDTTRLTSSLAAHYYGTPSASDGQLNLSSMSVRSGEYCSDIYMQTRDITIVPIKQPPLTVYNAPLDNFGHLIRSRVDIAWTTINVGANTGSSVMLTWLGGGFENSNYIAIPGRMNGPNGYTRIQFAITARTETTVTISYWNDYGSAINGMLLGVIGVESRYGTAI